MRALDAKERARRCAGGQEGRITFAQLLAAGLTRRVVAGWVDRGELIRTLPRVYAVGYVRTDLAARLWDAILYAGPGASLTGSSAAHHCALIDFPPRLISVATPRNCKLQPGIKVLERRPEPRRLLDGLPVAPTPELMLALAGEGDYFLLRKALSNLEYRRQLEVAALLDVCRHGRPGSALLKRGLNHRLPQLAHCRSPLEVAFLLFLETNHLPLPRFNVRIHGILVDCYWKELGLVIELDGTGNHRTAYQKRRDAGYMATLRGHGLSVHRFGSSDVHVHQAATLAQLAQLGVRR